MVFSKGNTKEKIKCEQHKARLSSEETIWELYIETHTFEEKIDNIFTPIENEEESILSEMKRKYRSITKENLKT